MCVVSTKVAVSPYPDLCPKPQLEKWLPVHSFRVESLQRWKWSCPAVNRVMNQATHL